MSAIAIGKGVDPYQLVMKPHCNFICMEDLVRNLVAGVVQQIAQFHGDLRPIDTDVFVAVAKAARPPPGLVKHLLVQVTNKSFVQQFTFGLSCRPLVTLSDIQLLPRVQISLGADVCRYQSGSFIRIKRGSTRRIKKFIFDNSPQIAA